MITNSFSDLMYIFLLFSAFYEEIIKTFIWRLGYYCQTSNISLTLVGYKIADDWGVFGA